MNRLLFVLILLFFAASGSFAQSSGFTYQGIAIDQNQLPVKNKKISLKISILSGGVIGAVAYAETQAPTTDSYGQFSVNVGTGTLFTGSLSTLQWDRVNYFLKVEADITGGSNYVTIGVTQIYPVPYALNANSAGSTMFKFDTVKTTLTGLKIVKRNDSIITSNLNTGVSLPNIDSLSKLVNQISLINRSLIKKSYDSITNNLSKKNDSISSLIAFQNTTTLKTVIQTTNANQWSQKKLDSSLFPSAYFDGVKSNVLIGPNSILANKIRNTSFTVEGWMRSVKKSDTAQFLFGSGVVSGWNPSIFRVYLLSGRLIARVGTGYGGYMLHAVLPEDTGWHHYAFIHDNISNVGKLYIDGVERMKSNVMRWINIDVNLQMAESIGADLSDLSSPLMNPFKGNLRKIRVSRGQVYKTDFTPSYNYIKADSTIAFWELNEGSGSTIKCSDSAYNGVFYNGYWQTLTAINAVPKKPTSNLTSQSLDSVLLPSVYFDGEKTNIVIGPSKALATKIRDKSFTAEGWIKSYKKSDTIQFIYGSGSVGYKGWNTSIFRAYLLNGKIYFRLGSGYGGYNLTGDLPADSAWHHFAFVHDNSTPSARIYIDGVEQLKTGGMKWASIDLGSTTMVEGLGANLSDGSGEPYELFKGNLRKLRISKGVVYKTDFVPDYKYVKADSTIAFWELNEGTGTKINCSDTTNNGILYNGTWQKNTYNSLSTGLVAYYPFNGNANDSSGNGNNGTVNGATLTTDRYGKANSSYNFNGVDQYIAINDNVNFRPKIFSISAWVYGNDFNGFKQILTKNYGTGANESINFVINNNSAWNVTAQVGGPNYYGTLLKSSILPSTNKWYHLVYVYQGISKTQSLYIDGVLNNTNTALTDIVYDDKSWTIGSQVENGAMNYYFNGKLDDIRIYNRLLDSSEVFNLYTLEKPPSNLTNGLVAYYPFNGNANDSSGNGNNATVTGASLTTDRFGKSNQAYSFDGNSNYISAAVKNLPSKEKTVSVWFLTSSVADQPGVMGFGGGSCGNSFFLGINIEKKNKFFASTHCNAKNLLGDYDSSLLNKWNHLVVTTSSAGSYFYLNGKLVSSKAYVGAATEIATSSLFFDNTNLVSDKLFIGSVISPDGTFSYTDGNSTRWKGSLDEFRLYNRALDSSEVVSLYDSEKPPSFSTGLVGYYPFNGNANDGSGNNFNGIVNGATLTTDRFNNPNSAYNFANTGQYIDLSGSNFKIQGNAPRTISCWINPANSNQFMNFFASGNGANSYDASNNGKSFNLRINPVSSVAYNLGFMGFTVSGAYDFDPLDGTSINVNNWTHVAVTYLNNVITFYVNGIKGRSTTLSLNTTGNSNFIGRSNHVDAYRYYNGKIDDLRIYDRALDSAELVNLYNSEKPPSLSAGLVAYYPFTGNANDSSGNGNNGIVSGATLTTDRFGNSNAAYDFNGSNSFIDVTNKFYNNGWDSSSISLWFKPKVDTSAKNGGLTLLNTDPHNGDGIGFSYNKSKRIYHWKGNANGAWDIFQNKPFNTSPISTGMWYNMMIVKKGLNYNYYVNGKLDTSFTIATAPQKVSCAIRIGAITANTSNPEVFNGSIDDIRIYNRALDTSEINLLYSTEAKIDLKSGLVAYYPFTGNANDSSGNGNNGTVNGATLTTDRFNNSNSAYNFNGTNNSILIKNSTSISIQSKFSVSVWVLMNGGGCNPRVFEINQNLNSCGGYTLAVNGASNTPRTIHVAGYGSCDSAIFFNPTESISSLQWNHISYTVDGVTGIGKFYLNGKLIQTITGSKIPVFSYNNNDLTIGNINSGRCDWWGGKIDDLRFYSRVLSDAEIKYLSIN